jgi:hypothetical protein
MMHQITREQLSKFLAEEQPPCISLYLPTHRRHPENQQDPIRFRNLLQKLESTLSQLHPDRSMGELLAKLQTLSHNALFWDHRTDGLGILCSANAFQLFDLQVPVEELLVVADSFHIKPLLRALQATDRYQILGLNRHEAKLYEGNRDALDEIELSKEVPRTIEQALGSELSEPHSTVASYGGSGGGTHGAPSMHHGHGQKKDEVEIDNDRFFRAIDRAILEHHSRQTGLPLILAALPEHHDLFRKISHNPFLVENGIKLDPQSISMERLRTEAWQVMEPHYLQRITKLVDNFEQSRSKQLGASDLTDIAEAMIAGRVGVLLVEADRQIPGKIDPASGAIEFHDADAPDVDDLLDDLAELTLKMGGEVMVIPAERMPSTSGAAATYRY